MRMNDSVRVGGVIAAIVIVSLAVPRVCAVPPDPDNAALLYYQAFLSLAELSDEGRELIADVARGESEPNDAVRQYLHKCQGGIEFAEAAAQVPSCQWGLRFSQGYEMLMPHLAHTRLLVYVLVADARVRAADGNYRGALERCLMTETLARHVGDETLVSYLVSISVRAVGYRCMEDLIGQTGDDAKLLEWLEAEMATPVGRTLSPIQPLQTEIDVFTDVLRMENIETLARVLGETDAKTRERITAAANEETLARARQLYVERVTQARSILASPRPYEQAFAKLEALTEFADPNDPAAVSVAAFMPAIGPIFNLTIRIEAHANAIKTAVAICLEKARSGQLPRNLPADAPKDPYSGQAFEYERTDRGFVLRCRAKELRTDRLHEYVFELR
ncbi:MAG: hypothetical protein JW993_14970 [Sedimentisphaerales bacterium]|nr:hypothetical protein [Sedimentisphaerales bacterium]